MSEPVLAQAWKQQERANEKVRRARQMMPFLRKLVNAASEIAIDFDREEVILDLEAMKDCLMEEVDKDPELDNDQKVMIANLVSGISKNWTRMQGFLYDDRSERPMALAFVMVAFLDIMFRRYKVRVGGLPPELEGLGDALGIEPPKD